jgi:hypothetical protein
VTLLNVTTRPVPSGSEIDGGMMPYPCGDVPLGDERPDA